jgi:hypothetical protein
MTIYLTTIQQRFDNTELKLNAMADEEIEMTIHASGNDKY